MCNPSSSDQVSNTVTSDQGVASARVCHLHCAINETHYCVVRQSVCTTLIETSVHLSEVRTPRQSQQQAGSGTYLGTVAEARWASMVRSDIRAHSRAVYCFSSYRYESTDSSDKAE